MTPRPRRPRTGGGDGTPPRTGDGTTARRPRVSTSVPSVRQAHTSVTQAANLGRPGNPGSPAAMRRQAATPTTRTPGQGQLPPGHRYDAEGFVRGPDGRYARDPNYVPGTRDRSTEYPSGYRQRTHDEMAARYTDEGQRAGGVPVDGQGRRIPPDQLTWRDEQGRRIPYDQLTYDHRPPVVEHWNTGGRNASRADRIDWYNDPDHLRPMRGSENSAAGGRLRQRYSQDVGPNYSE